MKLVKKLMTLFMITIFTLFTVYQFNLDMKLIGWLYLRVNEFHARKVRDIQF